MPRHLNFEFKFPASNGEFYDFQEGAVYIFGDSYEEDIEDRLNHGVTHFVIQKIAGIRASQKFDDIVKKENHRRIFQYKK